MTGFGAVTIPEPNEWQWADPATGLTLPWFTRPFLDELLTWDLADARVLEYGTGYGSVWFASRCRELVSIDNDAAWTAAVRERIAGSPFTRGKHELVCEPGPAYAAAGCGRGRFDLVVIDGADRDGCLAVVHALVADGGRVIVDNADEYPAAERALGRYPAHRYPQPGHPHWRTDYYEYKWAPRAPENTTRASYEQKLRRGLVPPA